MIARVRPACHVKAHAADPPRRVIALTGRIERIRALAMAEHGLDVFVAAGSEAVNHLCGYWRYFGSPPALVVGRDGARTLVVQLDEAEERAGPPPRRPGRRPTARAGFGLVPDQPPARRGSSGVAVLEDARPDRHRSARGDVLDAVRRRALDRRHRSTSALCSARSGSSRTRDELERISVRTSSRGPHSRRAERPAAGVSEIELFTAGSGRASSPRASRSRFVGDLLSGRSRRRTSARPSGWPGSRRVENR